MFDDGWEVAASNECSDGFGVRILVHRPTAAVARLAAVSDERPDNRLSQREIENGIMRRVCEEAMRLLELQDARLDPATADRISATRAEFETAFARAGLAPIYMEPIENGYWPASYAARRLAEPWYVVTTHFGRVTVGWRKSVIMLDWREHPTLADVDVAPDGSATHDCGFVHSHGYEALERNLRALAQAAVEQGARPQ